MSRSANGRSSFALASVVTMRSCLKRLVAILFSVALRWLAVRDSWRCLARCRITPPPPPPPPTRLRHGGRAPRGGLCVPPHPFHPPPQSSPFPAPQRVQFA